MVRGSPIDEEARALLAAGEGHRCHLGDCLHLELQDILARKLGRFRLRNHGAPANGFLRNPLAGLAVSA